MKQRILLGMTFTLALGVPACALAQAAAEAALANAASSAATAKAGSALSSAVDRSSKQLAGRVQRQVSPPAPGKASQVATRPVSTASAPATAGREGTPPAQGPMIASIQGAATSCAPTAPTTAAPGSKTAAESAQASHGAQDCAGKPAHQNKSVITISFSK